MIDSPEIGLQPQIVGAPPIREVQPPMPAEVPVSGADTGSLESDVTNSGPSVEPKLVTNPEPVLPPVMPPVEPRSSVATLSEDQRQVGVRTDKSLLHEIVDAFESILEKLKRGKAPQTPTSS